MRTVKTDQTGQMPRLIRDFAARTSHFDGFVMRRLKCVGETGYGPQVLLDRFARGTCHKAFVTNFN